MYWVVASRRDVYWVVASDEHVTELGERWSSTGTYTGRWSAEGNVLDGGLCGTCCGSSCPVVSSVCVLMYGHDRGLSAM